MLSHIKGAFGYSWSGLCATFEDEIAFRIVLLQTGGVLLFILLYPTDYAQKAFLILSASLCIIVELLNSAIENTVDLVTGDWHALAKKAKDMGSAAQCVASLSLYLQLFIIFS